MKKLIFILLSPIIFYAQPSTPCGNVDVKGVFIGDSNTSTDTRVGQGLGFVNRLNVQMGYHYEFFNGGCYGATTRDWWLQSPAHQPYSFCYSDSGNAPRLYDIRALPYLPADFAVIMLGSNDSVGALENNPTPVAEYGQSLEAMAQAVSSTGTPLVILMTAPTRIDCIEQAMQQKQSGFDCINRLEGYRTEVQRICNLYDDDAIICGPDILQMTINDPWVYFNPQVWNDFDKTHLTNAGHQIIADALQALLIANGL